MFQEFQGIKGIQRYLGIWEIEEIQGIKRIQKNISKIQRTPKNSKKFNVD